MPESLRLPLTPSIHPATTSPSPPATVQRSDGGSFRAALRGAARDMAQHEARLDHVLAHRGAALGPEQLLALQATVHRYSQEVELAAKLTDKLTGAVRQVLTSQQ